MDSETAFLVTHQLLWGLPNNSDNNLCYLPLSLRWPGTRPDKTGSTSFNVSENIFLQALASARSGFRAVAGSPQAGGNYTTVNAGLIRLQNLSDGWSASLNANGQWASEPLDHQRTIRARRLERCARLSIRRRATVTQQYVTEQYRHTLLRRRSSPEG